MNTPLLLTQSLIQTRQQDYLTALNLLLAKALRLGWETEAQETEAEIATLRDHGHTGRNTVCWSDLARLRGSAERDLQRLRLASAQPDATAQASGTSLWKKIKHCIQGTPAAKNAAPRQARFALSLTSSTIC
jgi:hypothetical protein